MYDLLCNYFNPVAVKLCFFLLLIAPLVGWKIAGAIRGNGVTSFRRRLRRRWLSIGGIAGFLFFAFLGYTAQKDSQRQAIIEVFSPIKVVLGSVGETISNLRNWLTPEEKKSRLLPVGLATNATAWVDESQCVTSQVREAWQRVPIRRAAFRQALPFPVTIGDNSYAEVFISSSGVIGFDSPKGSELTREMPYEEAADHVYLALLWGRIDFKPRLGSKMWCGVKEDGNFVASYDTVFIDGDTNAVARVQVEFLAANGDMILRYSDLPPCSTNAHRAGFQNLDGGWTLPFDNIRSNTALYLKAFGPLNLTVQDSDTDGDGISDYYELYPTNGVSITDPCNRDSDGDGLTDGEEVHLYATDPGAFSSDASGEGDLWRLLGGLSPSDAPYTNATPSGSLGILTVTTVLEGGTTNGGAVLRIADQYIPVLFGTTLVSRIAVPRDATNLFILARGANCDDAIAHITVEASTFTKIRDPSGVFGWSFTLSPACVTASGAIIMPSYTITPSLVCFHSPTSSVCRITSADPDIYFVTTQGLVREYTPPTPDMPTNSFSIGVVQIQLACMNMALSTRASVTNIPCHLCNPDSGFDDDYPDSEYYSTWCKFENGVHVYADGYGPTNCPCLQVFTNAFECICSGDGRKPCTCAHTVSDPKAMPQDGSQTNVIGHAVLKIGGTNDLLQVTVPEGTYRPCPLCACASGVPSSADIYRQTSCIEVTPGTLTTNGAFSVAGISPSTNFADTVFMYCLTDYSSAQKVASYTRKDYTVLGTLVYPADTGHSVSNWFVRYGWTNAITFKTDVRLPTGIVKLSITGEYDAYSLFVSNRVTHVYDEIIRSGHDEFQTSIAQWLTQYVDSNNFSVAYLTQACAGTGEIYFSFESSYRSTTVSCDAKQKFTSYNFLVEAVSSENRPSVYNPSGIAEGDTATYQIVFEPDNYPNSGIHWSTTSSNIEFVNGNTGRTVNVKGITAADTPFRLDIDIDGIDFPMGQHPYLEGKVLTLQTLDLNVYIICDDDGTNPVVSNAQVDAWITVASNVFRQVAMPIRQISNVHYINKTSWKIANTTNILMDIVSYTNAANALSIYCIDSLLNGDAMGAVVRGTNLSSVAINGIVISSTADEYTLSHEIGHECTLCDILNEMDSLPSNIKFGDDLIRQEWVTEDWTGGSGTGFYFGELTQSSMMQRLLMFGKENIKKGDISLGNIYGFDSHGNRIHVKTGISGMNRAPLN